MVEITQRDLPYLVLTEDPNLQAYRTDRISDVEPHLSGGDRRPLLRAGLLRAAASTLAAREPARLRSDDGGSAATGDHRDRRRGHRARRVGAVVLRSHRRRDREPLEVGRDRIASSRDPGSFPNELTGAGSPGKVAAAVLTLIFVLVFNFFLFRVMGDPTTQLARLPQRDPAGDRSSCAPTTGSTSR